MSLVRTARRALAALDAPQETFFTGPNPGRIPLNSELPGGQNAIMLVTEQTALALSAASACVSLIADSIAMFPIDALRNRGGARERVSPIPSLIADTFGDGQPEIGIYQAAYSLLMRGNWYSFINRSGSLGAGTGPAIQLSRPIHPSAVEIVVRDGEVIYKVNRVEYPSRDILHVPGLSVPGSIKGMGPIDYARASLGLGLGQQEYAVRFFAQDAQTPIVITVPADAEQEQIDELIANWKKSHQGVYRAHQPGILSGGADIKALAVEPKNAQFLEARKFQVAEVARLFRVPPHMIGDVERSTSWGTGIEAQGINFTTYTLGPWISRIERALTRLLPRPQYAKFNVDALLRADTLTRYEAYERARNAGWMNADEIRELEDRPPIPDGKGQDYLQPLNYAPAGSPAAIGSGKGSNGDQQSQ